MTTGQSPHSYAALEELHALPAGAGGRMVVVAGAAGPWYAGLSRGPAATLLEAALTFLDPAAYGEVLVISGTGPHLPSLAVSPAFRVGLTAGAWRLRGDPPAPAPAAPPAPRDPDLMDLAAVRSALGPRGADRVVWTAAELPWAERVAGALALVEERLGLEWQGTHLVRRALAATRALVVIDDRLLLPSTDELREPAHSAARAHALDARFADLASHLEGARADVVLLAHSGADAAALRERGLLAAALERQGASADAVQRHPRLAAPLAPVLTLPAVPADRAHGAFYPGAPAGPLAEVLRRVPPRAAAGPLEQLEAMTGLGAVKRSVRGLVARLREDRERRARGLPVQDTRLHTVFYGNPGTGKTTVARLMARVFADSGLLSGARVTEVTRADLVGQYVGETTQKTARVCREALGGVLFVDEAYALHRGEGRDYGVEAVDELVKWMSDRPRDLAVILAGYPEPMRRFIAEANPGLVRRFDFHLQFEDYTDDELVAVVAAHARREEDELDDPALAVARQRLAAHRNACARAEVAFGNAGDAIRLLHAARRARTIRIALQPARTREDLARLTAADFARAEFAPGPSEER